MGFHPFTRTIWFRATDETILPQTGLFAGSPIPATDLTPASGFTENGFDGSEFRGRPVEPPFQIEVLVSGELFILSRPNSLSQLEDSELTRDSEHSFIGKAINIYHSSHR
ncbi:hypothetical protein AKJ63_01205 [candidate division MSBL1 archaeon SCGC-AAA259D18]|uniref:Uncharacterized protein n=1 Tax=candidate division MSBL1 archaeon SCGC-AAA259D18 TaxID=1698262 RepID=A0A133UBS0_9EURY|nr:hypothetical protein AKJ63_01205 [candidate division MSBL1 archaeon SCGC-AAA259D18]